MKGRIPHGGGGGADTSWRAVPVLKTQHTPRRRRKPWRAPAARVEQAFVNAARSVEKGKLALRELTKDSRAALLESAQGEKLREVLLKLRADIFKILRDFPQSPEAEELEGGIGQNVRYPPDVQHPSADAPDQASLWRQTFAGLTMPPVRTSEIELRPPRARPSPPPHGAREEAENVSR